MNNIQFQIGDKVIALNNPGTHMSQPRVKGKIYFVHDTNYCSKCGVQNINIGVRINFNSSSFFKCSQCNNKNAHNGLYWTRSKFFAKLDDIESTIKEAVEQENYELADLLSKIEYENI